MSDARPRFLFITGGVVSSLGKGLSAAALGALLQAHGYRVRLRKLDPYLNVDAGTMSPYQHGEVYVTDDGAETDLDLGHYERFTGVEAHRSDNVTSGRVYERVLARERRGDYLGGTVQVIPHVTDTIKEFIGADTDDEDFVLVEIGGTVGDIEGLPFLEAIRQFGNEVGRARVLYLHLTLVPYLEAVGEQKTKPTQHSVKELRGIGIQPDLLLCRCDRPIPEAERAKLALFCNVDPDCVVPAIDADTVYEVPAIYRREGLDTKVLRYFDLAGKPAPDLERWHRVVDSIRLPAGEVNIAVVGKYTGLQDAYKSLIEALVHSGVAHRVGVRVQWLDAELLEPEEPAPETLAVLQQAHGVLVPGGFGDRGITGKMRAIEFARTRKVPYFGICLGLQLAVVEVARTIAGIREAGSTEFGACTEPVVGLMTEWVHAGAVETRDPGGNLGGTMRLGGYDCVLDPSTRASAIYGTERVRERHRHRYEVNPAYEERLRAAGLRFSGKSPDGALFEIAELSDHPWFFGVQFHPELRSRPFAPHPLFTSFIEAAIRQERLI
ncbi:MAG: CTP synthase [Rhodospirillales bacterium]|nr:CTP synthase [Rhodospirillales bacterium]